MKNFFFLLKLITVKYKLSLPHSVFFFTESSFYKWVSSDSYTWNQELLRSWIHSVEIFMFQHCGWHPHIIGLIRFFMKWDFVIYCSNDFHKTSVLSNGNLWIINFLLTKSLYPKSILNFKYIIHMYLVIPWCKL